MKYKGRFFSSGMISIAILLTAIDFLIDPSHHLFIFISLLILLILAFISGILYDVNKKYQSLNLNKDVFLQVVDYVDGLIWTKDLIKDEDYFSKDSLHEWGIHLKKFTLDAIKPYVDKEDVPIIEQAYQDAKLGKTSQIEFRILKGNEVHWVHSIMIPLLSDEGKLIKLSGIISDITNRKSIDLLLEETEKRYKTILNKALVGIYFYQDGQLVYVNPYVENLLLYSKDELLEIDIQSLVETHEKEKLKKNIEKLYTGNYDSITAEYQIIRKDGSSAIVQISGSKIQYNKSDAIIGTVIDITDRKKMEEQSKYKAYHDELTGLYNRAYINMFIDKLVKDQINESLGIIFIDLDRFKMINDSLGHTIGDELLILVAKRLSICVGKRDIVGRYGGDEFFILLKDQTEEQIELVCQKIIHEFSSPFDILNQKVFILPSIGISIYPKDSIERENLIKYADNAMYYVKDHGRNNYKFYDNTLNLIVSKKFELESDLRQAIVKQEFELYYQPLYDLKTNKIVCFEALIRWNHPKKGMIPPLDFIPLAEEIGMIIPIGNWVIEEGCKQIKAWNEQGYQVKVAVNVSYSHFIHESFIDHLKQIIQKTGIDSRSLEIEITESVMQHKTKSQAIFEELKNLGIKTAVDDFGTGYSSLSVLKSATLRNVKIDKEFIQDIHDNQNSKAIVKTIIDLGENLKFDIVAEGIETKQQLDILLENKCIYGQGYLFNRPLPVSEIIKLLEKEINENIYKTHI